MHFSSYFILNASNPVHQHTPSIFFIATLLYAQQFMQCIFSGVPLPSLENRDIWSCINSYIDNFVYLTLSITISSIMQHTKLWHYHYIITLLVFFFTKKNYVALRWERSSKNFHLWSKIIIINRSRILSPFNISLFTRTFCWSINNLTYQNQ